MHKMPTFKAPLFRGQANESFIEWLRDLNDYATCMNWSDDNKLSTLPMLLDQRAKQVYQDLPATDKRTWKAAIGKLTEIFGNDQSTDILNYQRLERVQGPRESVREYAIDMCKRITNAGIKDERHKLSTFYRGLLPAIKSQIAMCRPTTLQECEKLAEIAQQNLYTNGNANSDLIANAVEQITSKLKQKWRLDDRRMSMVQRTLEA